MFEEWLLPKLVIAPCEYMLFALDMLRQPEFNSSFPEFVVTRVAERHRLLLKSKDF